jgi:hypothetical protein
MESVFGKPANLAIANSIDSGVSTAVVATVSQQ